MAKGEVESGAVKPEVPAVAEDAAVARRNKKKRVTSPKAEQASAAAATAPAPTTPSAKDHATSAAVTSPSATAAPKPSTKTCVNCQKDLSRNIRITCAECKPQPQLIEFCVECFAVGIELGGHKKHHKYTVSDCLAFPIVRASATGEDDDIPAGSSGVLLTEAAGKDKVAGVAGVVDEWTADEELLLLEGIEMFGMGNWKDIAEHVITKTEKKCETHYMGSYLSTANLLPRFIGDPESADANASSTDPAAVSATQEVVSGPISSVVPESASGGAVDGGAPPPRERSAPSQLAGYMPLRGDFDVEYDNEAELILADMEFTGDEHPSEHALKLQVIEIYNQKLTERERRKKFVVERGLLDYKLHQQTERRRPKDEREIIAQLRPFARFHSAQEHEKLVDGMISAMRLRKQIMLLQEYRKNGVRTLAEIEFYDSEKKKRDLEQAIQKQRESASYLYESGRPPSSSRDRASRWQVRDQGANGEGSGDKDHPRTRAGNAATTANGISAIAASFNIDETPASHLLTPKEKELCSKLKMLPKVCLFGSTGRSCRCLTCVAVTALPGYQGCHRARIVPPGLPDKEDGEGHGEDW